MSAKTLEDYRVVLGDWATCGSAASEVRHEVFVQEQHVAPEEEMDDRDAVCMHAVVYTHDGVPIATGRLLPDGHIGRMAVRRPFRGQGIGSLVLTALIDEARRHGHLEVALAAQVHAQRFYATHGFIAEGTVFLDAGIDHVTMRRVLTA